MKSYPEFNASNGKLFVMVLEAVAETYSQKDQLQCCLNVNIYLLTYNCFQYVAFNNSKT